MYYLKKGFIFIFCLLLFSGCSTDNVVSNSIIQKRKYTKGYHLWAKHKTPLKKTESKDHALIELPDSPTPDPQLQTATKGSVVIRSEPAEQKESIVTINNSTIKKVTVIKTAESAYLKAINSQPQDSILPLPPKTSSLAIVSVVLGTGGIAALALAAFGIAILVGIVAMVFAKSAMNQIKRSNGEYKGKGMATLGYVLGGIPLLLMVAFIVFILLLY